MVDTAPSALDRLRALLPPDRVLTDETSLARASLDAARFSRLPSAVIRVHEAGEVGSVLQVANETLTPVTVRGAGSATTAAATPVAGGWALDLSRLAYVEIDAELGFAHAGPGLTCRALDAAAREFGWFYPPDPSSAAYSTIGGNIATNAGGLRGAKYGVTRDYVVALEGYLPTGEPVKWGRPLRKDASGFNLRDLWVGSEGMLGVVTKATLRLLPEPAARRTALAAFSNEAAALDTVREILRSRLMPSVLEFLDRQSVACAERFVGETMMPGFPEASLLLIELDGHPAQVAEDGERLAGLLEPAAAAVTFAQSPDEAEALWRARRKCSPAMFEMGNTKLNEDIVVPPGAYHELIAATLAIKAATGLATPTFGHAADGNFHVHIMYDHGNADQERAAAEALHQLMEKVVALGGTISGEHGIGLAKSPFLRLQHSEAELGAMQRIKAALDPNNVLNPDKVFAPFPLWEQPRDWTIVFPWDHRHS